MKQMYSIWFVRYFIPFKQTLRNGDRLISNIFPRSGRYKQWDAEKRIKHERVNARCRKIITFDDVEWIFFSSSRIAAVISWAGGRVWFEYEMCCMFLAQISSVNTTLTGSTGIIWELRDIKHTDLWTPDYQQSGVNHHHHQFIKVPLVSHQQTSPTWFTLQGILI